MRKDEVTLDPQVERELKALEAALAGEPLAPDAIVEPGLAELAELAIELRELRPRANEDFAAELDERVAAGFRAAGFRTLRAPAGRAPAAAAEPASPASPRDQAVALVAPVVRRLRSAGTRLRQTPPRRLLTTAGAGAVATVVIGTAVFVGTRDGLNSSDPQSAKPQVSVVSSEEGAGGGAQGDDLAPVDVTQESGGVREQYADAVSPSSAPEGRRLEAFTRGAFTRGNGLRNFSALDSAALGALGNASPVAAGEGRRRVETAASIVLGTDREHVQDISAEIFETVGRYGGIVLSSRVRDGEEGVAGADFELAIPSAQLPDALADLSGLAEVRSRQENTLDITAPYVSVTENIEDTRAIIEGLLDDVVEADSETERQIALSRLRFQRERLAGLRATRQQLDRRANMSRVSLELVTGDSASFDETDEGAWGVSDALDDAGRVLAVAAGIALISLAVLVPLALLALLIALTRRGWVRQSREKALG